MYTLKDRFAVINLQFGFSCEISKGFLHVKKVGLPVHMLFTIPMSEDT